MQPGAESPRGRDGGSETIRWLIRIALVAAAGGLLWAAAGIGADRAGLVTGAVAVLTAGFLLVTGPAALARDALALPRAAVLVGAVCLGLLAWQAPSGPIGPLALGVGILSLFLGACVRWLNGLLRDPPAAVGWVLLSAWVCATAPLWAGTLLETGSRAPWLADAVVGLSPLSYLASLADWDYLRHDWFYRHSPLGGLRFDYPSPATASAVYLGLAVLARGLPRLLREIAYRPLKNATKGDLAP